MDGSEAGGGAGRNARRCGDAPAGYRTAAAEAEAAFMKGVRGAPQVGRRAADTASVNRSKQLLLAALLLLPGSVLAATPVAWLLEAERRHGHVSAEDAIARLRAAPDTPTANAPLDLRRQYYGTLAELAIDAPDKAVLLEALARLNLMATRDACQPCRAQWLLASARQALRERRLEDARGLLDRVTAGLLSGDAQLALLQAQAEARYEQASGHNARALARALDAIDAAERLGSDALRVRLMVLVSSINSDLGDMARAEEVAKRAYELADAIGYREAQALLQLNLSNIYSRTGKREEQRRALAEALAIAERESGLAYIEVTSLSNLADYFIYRNDFKLVLDYATRAVALANRVGDHDGLSVALANRGIAMAELGDVEGGVRTLRASLAEAEGVGNKRNIAGITAELVRILERAGRYREALQAMHRIEAINQELTQQERERAVIELQEKYDSERKSREIERLSTENQLNAAEVSTRALRQRLWAAFATVLALASALLLQWLYHSRRNNRRLRVHNAALAQESTLDALTGAHNRRHFERLIARHTRLLEGEPAPSIGLVVLDLDHFKQINDTHGHEAGDAVLREVARRLRGLLREQDAVVRWGGEEFVLVLPGVGASGMGMLAARMLHAIGGAPVDAGRHPITVTASAGCATHPLGPGEPWQDAFRLADAAMYLAKQRGRNRAIYVSALASGVGARTSVDLLAAEREGRLTLREIEGPETAPSQAPEPAAG